MMYDDQCPAHHLLILLVLRRPLHAEAAPLADPVHRDADVRGVGVQLDLADVALQPVVQLVEADGAPTLVAHRGHCGHIGHGSRGLNLLCIRLGRLLKEEKSKVFNLPSEELELLLDWSFTVGL